ncbi:glycosyltransferase family 87 protein [Corynebacterium sp.]|uniref:glycosyltransferase family 87 protein n=1 Tax=Corynebacterium sp. TaxID=1720 RepID=UPI002A90A25E|nr:glycosyltransferase family 87 protein [Corynebacterium sp.]MDY5786123.1 glycosyltransferase family 87 protein [Corynebacterium sp.]
MNTTRLSQVWTCSAPPAAPRDERLLRAVNAAAWPFAILAIVHRLFVLAWAGSVTDDFTTVWSAARRFVERVPVYNEVYEYVDPHYLYSPGATLLLSPLGLLPSAEAARPGFVLLNAVAIIVAVAWLVRRSGFSLSHPLFPVSLAAAFLTEAVTNTLVFSNINGVLLLVLVGFLVALVDSRQWPAGLLLGVAILIKPMFAPLIVLPLMRLQWRAVVAAVAVPAAMNLLAWPITPGVAEYTDRLVPYLAQTRDYANSSLAGFAVYFGMPAAIHAVLFVLCASAVTVAVIGLARFRYSDSWLWACTSAGVLIAGVCLLSSLGQAYYSLMLFPAIATAAGRNSPLHLPTTWLGILLCLVPLTWNNPAFGGASSWIGTFLPTAGWAVFLISVATWAGIFAFNAPTADSATPKGAIHDGHQLHRLDGRSVARET